MSPACALFICAVIRHESFRYNYARKWTIPKMRESLIKLPSKDGLPDVDRIETFMNSLPLSWMITPYRQARLKACDNNRRLLVAPLTSARFFGFGPCRALRHVML